LQHANSPRGRQLRLSANGNLLIAANDNCFTILNDAASGAMTERVNASGTITWKSYLMADAISVAVLVPARVSPGRRLIRSFPDPPPVRGH